MADNNYFQLAEVRRLVSIAENDSGDDQLINEYGSKADRRIDNKLKKAEINVPLTGSAITDDIRLAANYLTASIYKAKKEDYTSAKYWYDQYKDTIDGIIDGILNQRGTPRVTKYF